MAFATVRWYSMDTIAIQPKDRRSSKYQSHVALWYTKKKPTLKGYMRLVLRVLPTGHTTSKQRPPNIQNVHITTVEC